MTPNSCTHSPINNHKILSSKSSCCVLFQIGTAHESYYQALISIDQSDAHLIQSEIYALQLLCNQIETNEMRELDASQHSKQAKPFQSTKPQAKSITTFRYTVKRNRVMKEEKLKLLNIIFNNEKTKGNFQLLMPQPSMSNWAEDENMQHLINQSNLQENTTTLFHSSSIFL